MSFNERFFSTFPDQQVAVGTHRQLEQDRRAEEVEMVWLVGNLPFRRSSSINR